MTGNPQYLSLRNLTYLIDNPNGQICRVILDENHELFSIAPGSSHNHQAWVGGYWDHVTEVMNFAVNEYRMYETRIRQMPAHERFSMSDLLLVLFLHDIEKPWRGVIVDGEFVINPELKSKQSRKEFRDRKLEEYGIVLNENQLNGLKHAEGVRDDEYTPNDRVMWPLAAFAHICDLRSARAFYNFGKGGQKHD